MESFFASLKHVREASGITLEEISDATLINLKMLEALERGEVASLPQAYVRAFIREYAAAIGLDPQETMRRYDAWLQAHPDVVRAAESRTQTPQAEQPVQRRQILPGITVPLQLPLAWKVIAAVIVLVLVDVALWKILEKEPGHRVTERPFREVVREQEERAKRFAGGDSDAASIGRTDSLTLVATTTDSVWMQIALDDSLMLEHFLYPRTRKEWKAKNRFVLVKIGNPMAIAFTLNNRSISLPVRPGTIARNVIIDRSALTR